MFNTTLTKYCPPVFFAEVLTSVTLPDTILLIDFTSTFTFVPDFICEMSLSGTIAITLKYLGDSTAIKGTPGFAISPTSINLLVTTPLNGDLIFTYANCASISFFI